jgi:PAS domain S-box-containing protein
LLSEAKYRDIYENAIIGIYKVTPEGRFLSANKKAAQILGYESAEELINSITDISTQIYIDPARRDDAACLLKEQGFIEDFEAPCRHKDGSTVWVSFNAKIIRDDLGKVLYHEGTSQDITARKKAEDRLFLSETKYRALVEATPDVVWEIDTSGTILYVSPQAYDILGYPPEDLIGKTIFFPLPPESVLAGEATLSMFQQGGTKPDTFELLVFHRDGRRIYIETRSAPVFDDTGKITGFRGTSRDITERKKAEEAIGENEKRLRRFYDSGLFGVIFWNLDGKITDANDKFLEIIGYTREDLNAGKVNGFDLTPPEFRHIDDESISELLATGVNKRSFEKEYIRKDGTRVPVILAGAMLDERRVNGVAFVVDNTERKKAEDALVKVNQKLNVFSHLMRKDLNNQVIILKSYLELLKDQSGREAHHGTPLEGIETAVGQVQKIIEYTKDYQDMGVKPPKWQNLKTTMLLGLSHTSIGPIRHSLETGDLEIFADPLLEKVCQRLFENSYLHGNRVTLVRVHHTFTPSGLAIYFEDDGSGIPEQRKEKIFERGEGSHGTRNSLIFVKEILDITGITIRETGEPGKGARFEMAVPEELYRFAPNVQNEEKSR